MTVVIVNYNSWPDVRRLVLGLAETPEVARGDCEVVVVDNASRGEVPPELPRLEPRVRLVLRPDNGGFSVGVNAGWKASNSPWILVLNPDIVIPEGRLGPIVARARHFAENPRDAPGIIGFGLRNSDGSPQPSVGAFPNLVRTVWEQLIPRSRRNYQPGWRIQAGPVDWLTGACVLMNGRMLESVGGMDEDFFLYYEEVALCRASKNLGWRVEYDPSVEVIHLHPLQNRAISSKMRVITRHSKLLYFRKHLPEWQFRTLAGVVKAEAAVRALTCRMLGKAEELRAWRMIARVAQAILAGVEPRGREVLMLAESISEPDSEPESEPATKPATIISAGTRRGR
ncbi:glycosyltransferase family 2 protein [Singulisphaera sp. PoT]|uniref:glycosyltransferase family 2 protein n=1 Tax=Singulisphaera sp. PoT TaxID=3411797 RepID=UPI003BF56035